MTIAVEKAPRFTAGDAVRIAAELYGLTATATPLPSERDQNFRLQNAAGAQYVLKIANSEERREILELQNAGLRHLGGDCWPRVIRDIESVPGHFVRLLTWIDGVCFAEVKPHRPELLASLGRALAEGDTRLASFSHPAAHRVMQWDLRQSAMAMPHLELLTPPQRTLVEPILNAKIDWDQLPRGVIYNDANDYNILVDPTGTRVTAFLDPGDMVYSAVVCDLAIALAYVMLDKQDPIAAAAQVVAGYNDVRPLTGAELETLYPLATLRLAMSVCYAAHQTRQSPSNAYLNISNAPAWSLLERLATLPAGWPEEVFSRTAGGRLSSRRVLSSRRTHVGPSLSVSYSEPLHIIRGWKQHLYSADGRAYLDCVNNVAHVGHCHPRVVEAAARQMARLNTNTRYLYDELAEYTERLTALLPEPLKVVYLVSSGSEANELALRLARAHTGRRNFIVIDVAYHGNTNALIEISPYKFNGPGGQGRPPQVEVLPMPDPYRGWTAQSLDLPPAAAFIAESALGCGGQIILPPDYLRPIYEQVRAAGGVCIADEVQTGFGRAGTHFWMFEPQGVVPDIVTLGKPIGNGHPIGAVITTPEIAASFANGMEYFSTFGGNPVSCAVGLAVLDVIRDEGLQANALETGNYLLSGLRNLDHPLIGDVRGAGLFLGIELVRDRETREPAPAEAGELVNRMKDEGILLSTDGPYHNVIKIKPPIIFSRGDADFVLERLDRLLPPV